MERSPRVAGGGVDDGGAILARFNLDVSPGCGGRHSTLLDEYERLAFEAQLNRAIMRRCYSEPSPARFAVQPPADAPAPHDAEGERRQHEPLGAGSFRRLHEAVARWLDTLKPVCRWLWSLWEHRRKEHLVTPRGPPTMPRVQLLDYLC